MRREYFIIDLYESLRMLSINNIFSSSSNSYCFMAGFSQLSDAVYVLSGNTNTRRWHINPVPSS